MLESSERLANRPLPTRLGRMLRASANRAPDARRSDERTRLSFAKSDDDVGLLARDARAAKLRQTAASVGQIARRRSEEERAEALFPPRTTTTAADPKRDCASSSTTKL